MTRVLIVGAGDVAGRLNPLLARIMRRPGHRVFAVVRRPEQAERWRRLGATPLVADLDDPASLRRLAGVAERVIYLAPPADIVTDAAPADRRIRRFLAVRARSASLTQHWVYLGTTGVYGDRDGAWIDETASLRPQSARSRRRADAEAALRRFGRSGGRRVSLVRAPGIYAADRLPVERLRCATPVIAAQEDGYTNHIHADDLARIVWAALWRGKPNRIYNAVDDSTLKMGDYFDLVADAIGLPRPPRISRRRAVEQLPAGLMSFLSESRRLRNDRLKEELKVRLRYPQVADGLHAARPWG